MEENILKNSEAAYFKTGTKMFTGNLILTDKRIAFTGEHARIQMNHGVLGNVIRDKVESAMGYDDPEQFMVDIPLSEVTYIVKRFGLIKRLVLTDQAGEVYKIQIVKKAEREEWGGAIDSAKKESVGA